MLSLLPKFINTQITYNNMNKFGWQQKQVLSRFLTTHYQKHDKAVGIKRSASAFESEKKSCE